MEAKRRQMSLAGQTEKEGQPFQNTTRGEEQQRRRGKRMNGMGESEEKRRKNCCWMRRRGCAEKRKETEKEKEMIVEWEQDMEIEGRRWQVNGKKAKTMGAQGVMRRLRVVGKKSSLKTAEEQDCW